MVNDIEQIAPTPWVGDDKFPNAVLDASGGFVCAGWVGEASQVNLCRDRIIACVNFCAGVPTEDLEEALRRGAALHEHWASKSEVPDAKPQPPADAGFAQVSALVKGLAQVSQLPGNGG